MKPEADRNEEHVLKEDKYPMQTTPDQMQRILETLFPRSKYATQPAPVETKVEVKIDDKKTTGKENTK